MILHENRLPEDDSHEISCLICLFFKSGEILNCRLLQNISGALRINILQHRFRCTADLSPITTQHFYKEMKGKMTSTVISL